MTRRFAFEEGLYETLDFMPLPLRYGLDLAGLKLSLAAWQRLPRAEREALVALPLATRDDVRAFAARVEEASESVGLPVAAIVPAPEPRPWSLDAALDAVAGRATALGLRVDRARWQGLDDVERYVAHRLSAPAKDEEKFRAALAELGLLA